MDFGSFQNDVLSDLELLVDNTHIDPLNALRSVTKILLCVIRQMSQMPFLFANIKKEINILKENQDKNQKKINFIEKYVFSKDFEPNIF